MFCTKCGVKLEEGTKFCIKCGTPVNASPVPNTPQPAGAFGTVTPEQMRVNPAQGIANQPYMNTQASWQNPPQTAGLQNKKNTKRNILIAVAGVVLAVVLIAGVFLNSPNSSQQQNANADDFYQSGKAAYDRKDYDQAIADFTKAIRLDPNNAEAYNRRGNAYSSKGNSNRAIADYTKAIQIDPNFLGAYGNRGYIYMKKGDYNRAIPDLEAELQLYIKDLESAQNDKSRSPEDEVIKMRKAMVQYSEEKLQEAKQKRGW